MRCNGPSAQQSAKAAERAWAGIGAYTCTVTAGAVASIAFGMVAPVVDGNVQRVFARLLALDADPKAHGDAFWAVATAFVDPTRPGDFNQSVMELGATVCVPKAPACDACPLAHRCVARRRGEQAEFGTKAALREEAVATAVVTHGGRVLPVLERRQPSTGL